jgi:DNA-binding MltR family transcriptional regulator
VEAELYEGSDHTAVLLSVSQLQNALERYVVETFAVRDEDELEQLTQPGGLLASFNSVIQLAYVLGLINKVEREHLDRIRAIRNVFAHAMRPIGFHMDIIAKEANKLPLRKDFTDKYPECTARERFVFFALQMDTEFRRRTTLSLQARLQTLMDESIRNKLSLSTEIGK